MDLELDLDATRAWLELLHGQSSGYIHVCATGQWEGAVCETVDEAVAYVRTTDLRDPSGIYVRATTIREPLAPGRRGGARDTACLPGLWADIDLAGPGHKTDKPLVPTVSQAQWVIDNSCLPEPSLWIHSGGGLYPWWLLDVPRCVDSEDELEELTWLSTTWQDLIAYSAAERGYFYGTEVKDLARVLRVPGTVNRKVPELPRPCRVADELGGATRYTLDELFDAAMHGLPKVQKPERTLPARTVDTGSDELSPGDGLEKEPWDSSLLLADWQIHHTIGDTVYWTRPGKSRRDGYSATTGYDPGRDRLYVFTSSTPLPVEEPLSKFAVYAHLHHGGDYSTAAAELRRIGIGGRRVQEVTVDVDHFMDLAPAVVPVDPPPTEETPTVSVTVRWGQFSWDDLGNGERFAYRYGDRVRWLVDSENWALFLGGKWETTTDVPAHTLAQNLINELPKLEAELYSDEPGPMGKGNKAEPSEREQFFGWVAKQRNSGRIRSTWQEGRAQTRLHAKRSEFDSDPMLLNCLNGTLDLRTGDLSGHSAEHMLMNQVRADWDESAQCPQWLNYLEKTIPDDEERAYLQRITGYSLTGDVSEQALFIHFGFGANGKSVFLDVLGRILGSYSIVVNSSTLLTKPYEGNHNADVARMAGRRLLRTSETNVGRNLDEAQVKLLTGGDDKILARYPYQKLPFEFYPTGKIHLATNHAPSISESDSIWRRIRLVGWDIRIKDEERDPHLARTMLREERSGILRWAVAGCLEWQKKGLAAPTSSELRMLEYRDSQSVFGEFLEDCVKNYPGNRETFSRLYNTYRLWCDSNGAKSWSGRAFSMAMMERGYRKWRTENGRGFIDVTVVTPMQAQLGWNRD